MVARGITGYRERIDWLRKREEQRNKQVVDNSWYQFKVTPTCPPSQSLMMRGGLLATNEDWSGWGLTYLNRQWTVPSLTIDLADSDHTVGTVTFSIANAFLGYLLGLALTDNYTEPTADDWQFRLRTDGIEYASASEAEAGLYTWLTTNWYDTNQPWPNPTGFDPDPPATTPLAVLILKNTGTVGNDTFLPIDRINRGRSYLWWDVRPRWLCYG